MDNEEVVISERIAIGISACCMGSPVRYNSKGFDLLENLGREKSDFRWCPVCPECMAGLGVPRAPIHLSGGDGSEVWSDEALVKNRLGEDVTGKLKEGSVDCMKALKRSGASAFVYMDGSPTCGVYRTTLKAQKRGSPPGVFGALLLENGYFLIPAADIQSPLKWWDWRRRLLAFHWLKNVRLEGKDDLYGVWHKLKFLCQELDETAAREMGRELAEMGKQSDEEFAEQFRKDVLNLLRKQSDARKIKSSLWKSYSFYRKAKGKRVEGINSPEFRRNITSIAKELILMERTSFEEGLMFGSSPVIYREKRQVEKKLAAGSIEEGI